MPCGLSFLQYKIENSDHSCPRFSIPSDVSEDDGLRALEEEVLHCPEGVRRCKCCDDLKKNRQFLK